MPVGARLRIVWEGGRGAVELSVEDYLIGAPVALCAWALGLSAYSRDQWHESVYAFCVVAAHRHRVPPVVCRRIVVDFLGPWEEQTALLQEKHSQELKNILGKWVHMAAERKKRRQSFRKQKRRKGGSGGDAARSSMCVVS